MSMKRLPKGGQIDRSTSLPFHFDGQCYTAHKGDTVASALLANGVRLMGRSFKYHRPRGVLSAGSEEPNALLQVDRAGDTTPNIRATVQEVYADLTCRSQNRWPSLSRDVMAVNDRLSRFLGAGFYYKTFMWPAAFWERLYEPVIRRAAGLGALSGKADTDLHDRAFAHCDLLVIGAGIAGITAALVAAKAGLDVILADEDFALGGRLLSERYEIAGMGAPEWAAARIAELRRAPNVLIMARTTITGAYDGGVFGAHERVADAAHAADPGADLPRSVFWRIYTKRAILASGAIERPIAFEDNDRPGIMLMGALRSYLNRYAVPFQGGVALFGSTSELWVTARDLYDASVPISAVIDARDEAAPEWARAIRSFKGAVVTGTKGRLGLSHIEIRDASGALHQIPAQYLGVSGGWNPALHLTCHMNGRPEWAEHLSAFVPRAAAVPGLVAIGAANGTMECAPIMEEAAQAVHGIAKELGRKAPTPGALKKAQLTAAPVTEASYALTPFWHVPPHAPNSRKHHSRAWLDFQNDVTVKDIKAAHAENFRSVEHMKRYTTLGMATDQGKTSNTGALAVMAELTGQSIPQTGTTTFRPPYSPIPIAALGAHAQGQGFAPLRRTPGQSWAEDAGAVMVEAGLWHRAAYFPQAGETHWRQSCDREVRMVREAVGFCEVSSLGKIDVQGPDAAAFLDALYAGTISTLKNGRIRYGLMLREDGLIMDDGTVARMNDTRFVITTTTVAAAEVMRHMEYAQHCLWPALDVSLNSVTDQFAQFAIAGPRARHMLNDLIEGPEISNESLPFMAHQPVTVGGVEGRLYRISFSGELGYELALPARFGDALAARLAEAAAAYEGGPYGTEALNVLRIEKGFVTHAEINGRVSADDIGMGRMVSKKKDSIGNRASERPGLWGEERQQLVGLRPLGALRRFYAGAHLFALDAPAKRAEDQGFITSACFSPSLGHGIALALVKDGRARHGEHMRACDLLRGVETICEICDPVFIDPEGERLRG